MSIDYKGHHARTGYLTHVTNTIDNKQYTISTAPRVGGWETAIFKRTLFGVFRPLIRVTARDETKARWVHDQVEKIAEQRSPAELAYAALCVAAEVAKAEVEQRRPAEWDDTKRTLIDEASLRGFAGPSDNELRCLARQGKVADAILQAFARDEEQPLNAPGLENYLTQHFRNQRSRDLVRNGYRLRLAEQRIGSPRLLVPSGEVDEVLRSNKSPQEKTEVITEYFDNHNIVGLGEPIRPYVLVRFDEIREVCERFVGVALEKNRIPADRREMEAELDHRLVAHGYAYRVAEGLLRWRVSEVTATSDDEPTDEDPWEYFRGIPNTKALLEEKAKLVADLIIASCNAGLVIAAEIKDTINPDIRWAEEEARQAAAETAAFLLSLIDRPAFNFLGSKNRDVFMEAVEVGVFDSLQDKGVDPKNFFEILNKRYEEYSHYEEWLPKEGKGAKGTLFWEFGKKVATILCVGRSAHFNDLLTLSLLKSFRLWELHKLLPESPR